MVQAGTVRHTGGILAIKSGGDIQCTLEETDNPIQFSRFAIFKTSGSPIFNVSETGILSITGNAFKPGGGSWSATSDLRAKKDVEEFADGLAVLRQFRPVRFRYNNLVPSLQSNRAYVGVIAQEVEPLAPYMVELCETETTSGENMDLLQFDPSAMPFLLTNAVKELDAEVQLLKAENQQLRQEQEALKEKMAQMEKILQQLLRQEDK